MIDVDDIARSLDDARYLLRRISDDLAPTVGKAGLVPDEAVADLLDLADQVQQLAGGFIYQHLRRVAQIKAEGAGGTLVSPSGVVGWRAVRPQGRFSVGGVVRMTDAELEEATNDQV
jgi:hypothetical protein